MDAPASIKITSAEAAQTEQIAARIAEQIKGGEVIELVSDLGGGKTTFVRGLARGLGSPDHVSSPTFKISNVYKSPKITIYHFDFYRLGEPGLVAAELAEVMDDPGVVVVVEWADVVRDVLPAARLSVTFSLAGEQQRELNFTCPPSFKYLLEKL